MKIEPEEDTRATSRAYQETYEMRIFSEQFSGMILSFLVVCVIVR
jgi:hypothetical protein